MRTPASTLTPAKCQTKAKAHAPVPSTTHACKTVRHIFLFFFVLCCLFAAPLLLTLCLALACGAGDKTPYALRLGINEREDYVLITDKQWQLFVSWYGGGPSYLRPVILQGMAVGATSSRLVVVFAPPISLTLYGLQLTAKDESGFVPAFPDVR